MLSLQICFSLNMELGYIDANPVISSGLFPNGKYDGLWLPMLNR